MSRQLDLRWKQTLATVIREGVAAGEFTCPDPDGAAWRLTALLDGLGVQVAVHRGLPAARLVDWVARGRRGRAGHRRRPPWPA